MRALLSRRFGRARRGKVKPTMSREQALRMLVSVLSDAYGGDGWDDPRLPEFCEGWMGHPASGAPYDGSFVYAEADALIEASFDPRHIAALYR